MTISPSTTHPSGSVRHLVREQWVGTHVSGYVVKVTVWQCRARCVSPIATDGQMLTEPCRKCTKLLAKRDRKRG